MRNKITPLIIIVALALMAGLTNRAYAQAYDKEHASMLILPGSGTDVAHTLTIVAPLLSGSSTLTLPGSNVPGILTNDGSGSLSWAALGASNIAPGANNTFLVTNGSGSAAWNGLSIDATLVGNGIGSTLGLNLAKANLWTAAQTIAPTGDSVSFVVMGTSAASPASDIIDVQNSGGSSTYLKVDKNGLTTLSNGLTVTGNIDVRGKWGTEEDSVTIVGGATNNNVSSGSKSRLSLGLSGTPATTTITGFTGGTNGSLLNIMNLTGQNVIFANESAGSSAGNRIRTRTGAAIALPTQQTVTFTWDQDFSEWILQGVGGVTPVSTGGTGLTTLTQNGILFGNGASPIGATSAAANSVLVTDGGNNPSLSQTLPSAVQANITSLTGMIGAITYPTALTFDGTSGRTMSMARNASTNPGQGLSIQAGAPASLASANNLSGGDLTLSSGISEGTGFSNIFFQTPAAGSIGNTDNIPVNRMMLNATQLNLASGVELDQNGTQRISSSGAGNFSSLTLGSPLSLSNGGTNASLTASNGGIFYSTASAGAILSGTATANQVLLSGANVAPAWSSTTYPATTTLNQLLYSSSANTIAGLATANNGVLVTSAGGAPSISSTLPAAVQGNITSTGTITSGTWQGTPIAIANGGTGQTTAQAALTALVPDSTSHTLQFLQVQAGGGYIWAPPSAGPGVVTSVNVSPGTTGLTATGGPITTSGTITLGGTLAIANGGTGQITKNAALNALVPDSTGNSGKVFAVQAGGGYAWTSVGTGNGSVTSISGSGGSTGLTLAGGPITTSGTLTLGGTLAVANGGTGQSSSLTQGGVVYGSTAIAMATSAAGTSGQLLISGGAGAPSFTSSVSGLTVTNSSIGSTSPSTGVFTSVTTPTVYGGSAANSSLNLQSTSSGAPSGDYITMNVAATEVLRVTSTGMGIGGITSPQATVDLNGTFALHDDSVTIVGNTSNDNVSMGTSSLMHIGESGTSGPSTITGFAGGGDGTQLTIVNLTGQNLTLANQTGSSFGNQIYTRTGGNIILPASGVAQLRRDDDAPGGGWAVEFIGGASSISTGGTGATSFTQNGILYGNGTNPIQVTSAAANSVLITNGGNVPSLSQTLPSAVQANITSLTGMTGSITYPTALTFDGTAARTMSLARNTGSVAGQGLTIQAGAPASLNATQNLAGGNLTLSSGISEGTGLSSIFFQTAASGGIGNTDNTPATRLTLDANNLNLGSGINLQTNGTTRISSAGAGTLASLTLGSALTAANGGTGQTSYTNGQLLIGNTTGNTLTPATLTAGTGISITNGTGSITIANTGFTSPMTTLGDITYENGTPAAARLAGTTSATKQFLTQAGNGTISAAPAWGTIAAGDVPTLNQNTTGTATNATNVTTTSVSTAGTYYPLFVSSSSNGNQAADLGTGLTFNPSTNTLSTTTFSGALSGNATNVTGIVALANGGTGVTNASGVGQNAFFGGPSGASGAASFRTLVASDIPSLSGSYLPLAGGTMSGNIAMGGNNITGGGSITSSSHILIGTSHNGTLQEIASLGQATTYTIPDPAAATATIALTTSNITGTSANVTGIVALANGGTGVTNATGIAQNAVFAGPSSGVSGAASFRALVAADIPTLNQNTTGTAANVTGTVAVANGGTGVSTASANTIFAGPASGVASAPAFRSIVANDIPTLNQNTTGTASNVTGTVGVANGGTGAATASANTIFAGPTSGVAAAPAFRAIVASDLPSLSGTYLPLSGGTMSGAIAMGGNNITGGGTMTGSIHNATTGFEINGAATSGNYLRGNGTNFVSSAIQSADLPNLSATYLALSGGTMSGAITMGGNNISGGGTITGTAITSSSLVLKGTSFNGTVEEIAALGQATTYTIPDPAAATATIALTTSNIMGTSANVTGIVALANGGTGVTNASGVAQNAFFGGPSGAAGAASFRTLVASDIPSLSGSYLPLSGGTMSGGIAMGNNSITGGNTISAATLSGTTITGTTVTATTLSGSSLTLTGTSHNGSLQELAGLGQATTYTLPDPAAATATIALTTSNITGTSANVTGIVALANGGTGVTNATGIAQNAVFAGPSSGVSGAASFRALAVSDIPTLNQNTTGTAANVTGTVAVNHGGTGQTSYTNGQLLIGNTTGNTLTPATLTAGTGISITNGTGSITIANTGLTNPMTTLGDIIYENSTPAAARLAGNTTSTKQFLTQTGNGTISTVPAWGAIAAGDIPTLNQNTTGTATNATNATNVATTTVSTNATYYPLFVASSINSNQAVDLDAAGITYNPSENDLTATTFTGALSGNATTATSATTATTATNATNVATTSVFTNASYYPLFVSSSSNGDQAVNLDASGYTYNPSTNALRVSGSLQIGLASSATGSLVLANLSSANLTTIQAGNASAAVTYTLPTAAPTSANQVLISTTSGGMSWANAGGGGGATFIAGSTGAASLPDNSNGYYLPLGQPPSGDNDQSSPGIQNECAIIVNQAAAVQNLTAVVASAPGTGNTATFTVYSNHGGSWASTGVTVTITGASTTASDNTHTFSLSAGDQISLLITTNYNPSTTRAAWAFNF